MFAVVVRFHLKPGTMPDFLPLMIRNAQQSRQTEPGCHQFDVLRDAATPAEVFLYELYSDEAAFQLHLETDHFKQFNAATSDMIADKDIRTYDTVTQ
ncbi:putative quinol monooxygenase [Shimia ponticola]|uniref:putative quinol monooxygenase n=1 Tax=Shimia ponticola TaxID=2582893 RepID=UPI0011BEED97|nr:putative quinol monooxygenase [Shimia ponticola]